MMKGPGTVLLREITETMKNLHTILAVRKGLTIRLLPGMNPQTNVVQAIPLKTGVMIQEGPLTGRATHHRAEVMIQAEAIHHHLQGPPGTMVPEVHDLQEGTDPRLLKCRFDRVCIQNGDLNKAFYHERIICSCTFCFARACIER